MPFVCGNKPREDILPITGRCRKGVEGWAFLGRRWKALSGKGGDKGGQISTIDNRMLSPRLPRPLQSRILAWAGREGGKGVKVEVVEEEEHGDGEDEEVVA